MVEQEAADYEGLLVFLTRVAMDPSSQATWISGGAKALLDKEGRRLNPEHRKKLEGGDCAEICAMLHMEADVTARQPGAQVGPCWVLVG